ncbi:DEAD/DEAH box helicase [Parasediminibacterium sp. JCM 36343]|uniref:DEAD/DEAH box helicase n=1 Tax=Parasediminibacterium sp. JCM 36343 TaxID=3374279 RepID=UPI00397C074D
MQFTAFNFHPTLLEGIEASNYDNATPVQEQVIPIIMAGKDLIASAQTGTGKTAAFLLPMMNHLIGHHHSTKVSGLILVPTRELAIQIGQVIEGLSYFTNISSIAIYGGSDGQNFVAEKKALQTGADIVVCTPGRLLAHLKMGYVDFGSIQFLVLDEADRMLDMGFQDDINTIISHLPKKRQTLLFSATMPEKIRRLARTILHEPAEINIAISKPPEKIVQRAYILHEPQKLPLVKYLLQTIPHRAAVVFCGRKQDVKQLARELQHAKMKVAEIHSDLEQSQREEVLQGFTSGRIPIIIATDILSRGIDVDTIDLVVNYDVPHDGEDYVHRIGRTARAEADGMAITLVNEKEQTSFAEIEQLLGKPVEKATMPEQFGTTPPYEPRLKRPHGGSGRHNGNNNGKRRNFNQPNAGRRR